MLSEWRQTPPKFHNFTYVNFREWQLVTADPRIPKDSGKDSSRTQSHSCGHSSLLPWLWWWLRKGIRTQQHKETPTWHLSWLELLGQRSFHPWCLALLLTRDSSVGHLHCGHRCPATLIWVLSRHLPRILPVLICLIIWVPMAASFSSLVLSVASLLPSHSRFKPNTLYGSRQKPTHFLPHPQQRQGFLSFSLLNAELLDDYLAKQEMYTGRTHDNFLDGKREGQGATNI